MRYVAAYLLANLSGNAQPDLKTLEKILSSVGIECDKDRAQKVLNELNGKDVADLIKNGQTKLASVPSGASAAPAAAAAAAPVAAAAAPAAAAPKKEEKKKEESEDEDMGFGLFD